MLKTLFAAVALLCLLSSAAEARQNHSSCTETGTAMRPVCGTASPVAGNDFLAGVRQIRVKMHRIHGTHARRGAASDMGIIAKPSHYIAGRLVCARNVNSALAERGITGTGSAMALSFRHWGRSAGGPVPGAVIVSARRGGGHVAIVSRVEYGVVYAWNATGGHRGWREVKYRHHVIDYRVPG